MSIWKTCQLGDLITFQRGHDLPKAKMKGNTYPVIGSNGIIGYHDTFTTEAPSITIGRSGNVGKPFLYNGRSWSHNTSLYIREYNNVDPTYIYYLLQTLDLENYAGGSAVPTLNRNHIHTINVTIPIDINEQKTIASALSTLDNKINTNEKINGNLASQVQTIFEKMFEENQATSTPARVSDVALNVTDGVHNTVNDDPAGEFFLLSCKNIKGGSLGIGLSERRISKETFDKLRRRTKLAKGDILISSVGTIGEILLLNSDPLNYEFQRSVAMIKPNPKYVSSTYLYASLVSKRLQLIHAAHGAVQQCLFISDIENFPICIPETEKLHAFDEIVVPMFDAISSNETENRQLADLRDSLLPKLMSGQLDISESDI